MRSLPKRFKPKHEYGKTNNEGSEANVKDLFSIFNKVCPNEFHRRAKCKHAKEAWDIVTHESMFAVKISKLKMLATKFENIRMHENQNFSSFDSKLSDIVNYPFKIGEPIID